MIELGELESQHAEFTSRQTQVVAVSQDGLDLTKETQKDFPHLVHVADHERKLMTAVAVLHPGAGEHGEDVAAPTTVFVDKQGVVRWVYRPSNLMTRLSATEVLARVD